MSIIKESRGYGETTYWMYYFLYQLFYCLEDSGVLDVNSTYDLYALHFVFLPIIQEHLDRFRQGWAHHSLRTEHNHTPQKLWIMGLHEAQQGDFAHEAVSGVSEVWCMYIMSCKVNIDSVPSTHCQIE